MPLPAAAAAAAAGRCVMMATCASTAPARGGRAARWCRRECSNASS
eukprot:COSAG01_NODE_4602_length_4886_cov_1.647796_7_plen_45_part_01